MSKCCAAGLIPGGEAAGGEQRGPSLERKLADFFNGDYDNSAAFVVLAHLSEQNNHPEIARREAEKALAQRGGLFHNRVLVAVQSEVLPPIQPRASCSYNL
jgi:hypothetical protein